MNYCKSSIKLGLCTANAKERHAIFRRVVTHAFLHWQPQSFEEVGSRHIFNFLPKPERSPTTVNAANRRYIFCLNCLVLAPFKIFYVRYGAYTRHICEKVIGQFHEDLKIF
jgi:hypothetical protein